MRILKSILRLLVAYFIFCGMAVFILRITGVFVDIESAAWILYDYLHSRYGLYDNIYQYDSNPLLGWGLILWVVFLPFITSALYFIIKHINSKYKTRRTK